MSGMTPWEIGMGILSDYPLPHSYFGLPAGRDHCVQSRGPKFVNLFSGCIVFRPNPPSGKKTCVLKPSEEGEELIRKDATNE